MKFQLRILRAIAICAALSGASASRAWGDAININFAGTTNDSASAPSNYDPGTVPNSFVAGIAAGAPLGINQDYNGFIWNNITGKTSSTLSVGAGNGQGQLFGNGGGGSPGSTINNLYTSTNAGAVSNNASVVFDAPRTWSNAIADTNFSGGGPTQQGLMLNNYIEGNPNGTATVMVNNIPNGPGQIASGTYDLYVYTAGATTTNPSNYTLTPGENHAASTTISTETGNVYNFTTGQSTPNNFIEFTNLTGNSFTLTANVAAGASGAIGAPIDAISIFTPANSNGGSGPGGGATPEPSSMILLALGALGIAAKAVSRRRAGKS